ncbi:MAG: rhomboid family intramembrane serine protease, partial [Actinomycetota bacterium]|nr:rhomboid family intramembrane serine protease [Actinomycetota bacterium]
RLTPWVGRILAILAGVQLLLATVLTNPAVRSALAFDPANGLSRPWTVLTYALVHGGLFHLLFNALALFVLGPTVERRLGGPGFLLYFIYCIVGAAFFAAILARVTPVPPFYGASGGITGLLLAYAMIEPDRELFVFPFPFPIRARALVAVVALFDLAGMLFLRDAFRTGVAYEAHLGGLAFGWLFFRLRGAAQKGEYVAPSAPRVPRPVAVGGGSPTQRESKPIPLRPAAVDKTQAELDRVLDKISATGMGSLTPDEKKFLDEVAKKKNEH